MKIISLFTIITMALMATSCSASVCFTVDVEDNFSGSVPETATLSPPAGTTDIECVATCTSATSIALAISVGDTAVASTNDCGTTISYTTSTTVSIRYGGQDNLNMVVTCSCNNLSTPVPSSAPSSAPVPSPPTPAPPASSCFSKEATVHVAQQPDQVPVPTKMTDLEIGDMVLTASNRYQPIYAFAHNDATTDTEFLQIHTTSGKNPLFDHKTGIALLVIADRFQVYNYNQVESAIGLLNFIQHENEQIGPHCSGASAQENQAEAEREALYQSYEAIYDLDLSTSAMVHAFGQVNASSHTTAGAQGTASTTSHKVEQRPQCWVPVILYYHTDTASDWFAYFVEEMLEAPNRPAVILDAGGNEVDDYSTPVRLNSTAHEKRDVWLHSYITNSETYWQHQITINTTAQPPVVTNVSAVFVESIADLPEEYKKDTLYQNQIRLLRQFANEAIEHDVVVGTALAMPTQRVGPYIRCLGGECEAGNLFANAMQWEAQTDIAFLASGGLRGNGWEAGPVHLSEIWGMLPFPNTICTGTMSGVSLFNILEYSIRTATFEKHQSDQAARLLQVAGLKITYNNKLPYGSSRLLAVDVWNQKQGKWKSLSPTRLYTFASSSYECGEYQPYPMLTGTDGSFSIQGEMGGTIGEKLVQDAVRDYLENLSQPYNTTLEGRITGVASEEAILDFLELEEDCGASEFYSMNHRLCMPCPDARHVAFSDELVQFKYQLGRAISLEAVDNELRAMSENDNTTSVPNADQDDSGLVARILLVNRELSNFTVIPKLIPSWLQMVPVSENGVSIQGVIIAEGQNYLLESGARLALNLIATPSKVTGMVGTVVGTVAVRVLADDAINTDPGMTRCDEFGEDVTFDAALTILPQEELNHLGDIRFMGLALMAIVMATSVGFALFVFVYRETRILKTMQPVFLMAICLGIFIMSSTILPLSFDDGIISPEQCSQMCISQPWLFSIGCTILFSVLFSKLWRINRLLHAPRFERLMVTEKDVMGPFLVLFTANVALLLTWTLVDPLQWTRRPVEDEPWKTYGSCSSNGIGYVFMGLIGLLLLTALLMACYQAYKARDISDEFSEGKNLGLALFTWIQVMLLGGPTLFLVDQENFTARFFIEVGLIAALGASMLLFIFVPLVKGVMELKKQPPGGTNHQSNHISGDRQQSMAVSGFPTSFESTNGVGAVSSRAAINPVRVRNMSASMREDIDTTEDPMHP